MTHELRLTIAGLGTRTIHFHSRIARLLGGPTNCVGWNADTILVASDRINRATLAHEWGHTVTAEKRGWLYLPWVIGRFLTQGYADSKAEREADEWGAAHAHLFPSIIYCPICHKETP